MPPRFSVPTSLLALALIATTFSARAWSQDATLDANPAWREGSDAPTYKGEKKTGNESQRSLPDPYGEYEYVESKRGRKSVRPWYQPRTALGVGLNVPELVPIEGYFFFGKYAGLRLFYAPPMRFNIRVEMPSDVISAKKGVVVANPDFEVRFKATYGAHYGAEAMVFPFAGSFFLSSGLSHRRMKLVGDAHSPVLVCSLIEGAKEDPCSDPAASIRTRTELRVHADAETTALLARGAIGGFWNVGSFGYFMVNLGASKPLKVYRDVTVTTELDTPQEEEEEVKGALAQVKSEREDELNEKAVKAMRPVDEKLLPIFGIAAGVRF